MIATILNSAILDSAILHKALTQTSSIWLKFIHSDSTWWNLPSSILPSWIQPFCTKKNFTHSIWLNLMMAAILNSAMLDSDTAILDWDTLLSSLRFTQKTLSLFWPWLKLIQSDSNSFILSQLDDISHLEICNVGFRHCHLGLRYLVIFSQIHSKNTQSILTLTQTNSIWLKLIHSLSTWWYQPSRNLQCWIQTLPSWIEISCYLLSDSLKKHSHSILTLTQTNSIWLKLIHSDSTWWWQSYWILPSWIQPS